jgi:adenosylmethionine-8-amino-7-oxononanoate aminotransferase
MTTLLQRDQKTIWHPFTQHQTSPLPLPVARGEGAYLFDTEGKAYLDLISSWWVNIHGHAHPLIARAIYEQALQLEHVMFAGFTHEPAVALAEKLLALLPAGFSKVFYSDNGATSVEIALKMAYQYWRNRGEKQRRRFLAFSGAYHGDTFGAMAVGQSSKFYKPFADLLFAVDFAPYPVTWQGDKDVAEKEKTALAFIEDYLKQQGKEVAAVIIEPLIQAANGMQICRPEFLSALDVLLRSHGILIIYDEVMTGFGRTGVNFACEKAQTKPDLICLSKGITGGFLPLAATICQEAIYEAFLSEDIDRALIHGHSYTGNPLGCAAGLASLELLQNETTQQQIRYIEASHGELSRRLQALEGVEKVRTCGTLLAFDVRTQVGYGSLLSQNWRAIFMERGLLIRPLGRVIYLLPPYCITKEDLQRAYRDILAVLEELVLPETGRTTTEATQEWF